MTRISRRVIERANHAWSQMSLSCASGLHLVHLLEVILCRDEFVHVTAVIYTRVILIVIEFLVHDRRGHVLVH